MIIDFACAPEKVDSLVQATFAEIDAIQKNGVGEVYVKQVKEQERRERELDLTDNNFWLAAIELYLSEGLELKDLPQLQRPHRPRLLGQRARGGAEVSEHRPLRAGSPAAGKAGGYGGGGAVGGAPPPAPLPHALTPTRERGETSKNASYRGAGCLKCAPPLPGGGGVCGRGDGGEGLHRLRRPFASA